MLGNSVVLENGLYASVDWISFTSLTILDVNEMIAFLGYSPDDFNLMPRGAMGYKTMYRLSGYNVCILADGNDDMGLHVDISGSAIGDVVEHFANTLYEDTPWDSEKAYNLHDFDNTIMIEMLLAIRKIGTLTRFDLAIDDVGCNYYTVDEFHSLIKDGRVITKFRTYKRYTEYATSNVVIGDTLYLGSRKSDVLLRIYDKRLEQLKKNDCDDNNSIPDVPWIRWELELKDSRANSACSLICDMHSLGDVVTGILNNYVRVIILDDSNRSRCSVDDKWFEFITTVSKLRLFVRPEKKTLAQKRNWFIRSIMPTLAGIIVADYGSFDIIDDNFADGVRRMSKSMSEIVTLQNPTWKLDCCDLVS